MQANKTPAGDEKILDRLQLVRQIIYTTDTLILVANREGQIIYASPSVERALGYSPNEVLGDGWLKLTRPSQEEFVREKRGLTESARDERRVDPLPYERQIYDKAGDLHWILWQDTHGPDQTLIGIGYDISAKKRAEEELSLQRAHFHQLFEYSPDAIVLEDAQGHVVDANRAFAKLFGYPAPEISGRLLDELIAPSERHQEALALSHQVSQGQIIKKETVRRRRDGSLIQVEVLGFPIKLGEDQIGIYGIYRDIAHRKVLEAQHRQDVEKLERLALYDALTGLHNRHHLDRLLSQELERAQRYGHPLTLLMLDLDGFKQVNDRLGHLQGDEVLRGVGQLIRDTLRESDLAFRYGGDEFLLLLMETNGSAIHAAERLQAALQQWVRQRGLGLPLSFSVGQVTWLPGMDTDGEALLREADRQLNREKHIRYSSKMQRRLSHKTRQVRFQTAFLDSLSELVVSVDLEGRVIYANRRLLHWSKLQPGQLLGQPLVEKLPSLAPLATQMREQSWHPFKAQRRDERGQTHTILVSTSVLKNERGTPYAYVFMGSDVTELEQITEQLSTTKRFLERLNAETDLAAILRLILEETLSLVPHADSGVALLLNEKTGLLEFVAAVGWDLAALQAISFQPEWHIQRIKYQDEPVIITDDLAQFQHEYWPAAEAKKLSSIGQPRSYISVPIKLDDQVIGYFNLNNKTQENVFTADDLRLACSMLPQLKLAIRRAQERNALARSEQRYHTLFEAASDAIFLLDSQGQNLDANPQACRLLGYGREELISLDVHRLIVSEELADSERLLSEMQRGQLPPKPYRKYMLHKNGTEIPVEFSVAPIYDEHSRLKYILSIARDLRQVVRLEKELRESEHKYHSLVEESLVGVYIVDNRRIIYANRRLAEITGYSQVELQQKDYLDLIFPEDRPLVEEQVQRRLRGQAHSAQYSYHIRRKDGQLIHVEVRSTDTEYRGRRVIIGTMQDISERVDSETRERQLHRQLEQTAIQTATMLSRVIDEKDSYTSGHCQRLADYAVALGKHLGLSKERLEQLRYAALLHDVGKVGVPDAILNKPGQLSDEEWRQMSTHVRIGAELVRGIHSLQRAAHIIAEHHEHWDGSGYPAGLRGEEILLEARILSVVDAYDAITTDRPYRRGRSPEAAQAELRRCAGVQWDPEVVKGLLKLLAKRQT